MLDIDIYIILADDDSQANVSERVFCDDEEDVVLDDELLSNMVMYDDVLGGGAAGESPAEALGLCG